jgi:hypothetical protein
MEFRGQAAPVGPHGLRVALTLPIAPAFSSEPSLAASVN